MQETIVRATVRRVEDLLVWQKAHQLVLQIYVATKTFPKEELFGLVSQMRRSAVSVPANIAEGFRRRTKADKQHFLTMAHGSLEETRYYLRLSGDLGYCQPGELLKLAEEVSKFMTLYFRQA